MVINHSVVLGSYLFLTGFYLPTHALPHLPAVHCDGFGRYTPGKTLPGYGYIHTSGTVRTVPRTTPRTLRLNNTRFTFKAGGMQRRSTCTFTNVDVLLRGGLVLVAHCNILTVSPPPPIHRANHTGLVYDACYGLLPRTRRTRYHTWLVDSGLLTLFSLPGPGACTILVGTLLPTTTPPARHHTATGFTILPSARFYRIPWT